ncbi:Hypp7349 [Branchiostoma lanceolatum]|uniref:Hypp7349 protein n=1 Tax=Branchiostoma lanceolatum TaxID=7740 RepID=A0A8J9YZS6_BRALA|nr:Hypp7349 [Branchiostoma lanceolatum]
MLRDLAAPLPLFAFGLTCTAPFGATDRNTHGEGCGFSAFGDVASFVEAFRDKLSSPWGVTCKGDTTGGRGVSRKGEMGNSWDGDRQGDADLLQGEGGNGEIGASNRKGDTGSGESAKDSKGEGGRGETGDVDKLLRLDLFDS